MSLDLLLTTSLSITLSGCGGGGELSTVDGQQTGG